MSCRVDGCDKPRNKGRTLCSMHANRWARHRSLDKPKPRNQAGENNHNWRGDSITYHGMHERLRTQRGPASKHPCVRCGGSATDWAYTRNCPNEKLSEVGFPYSADTSRYQPMCKLCHLTFDRAAILASAT